MRIWMISPFNPFQNWNKHFRSSLNIRTYYISFAGGNLFRVAIILSNYKRMFPHAWDILYIILIEEVNVNRMKFTTIKKY